MSLETWNTFDNLPQLSAGQKVFVIYTEESSSKVLADICIDYYGETSVTIVVLAGFNKLFWQHDDAAATYDQEAGKAYSDLESYNCQKIFIAKNSIPNPRKSSANLNMYALAAAEVARQTGRKFDQLAEEGAIVAPHTTDTYQLWALRHAASNTGVLVDEYLRSNPDHPVNQKLAGGNISAQEIWDDDGPSQLDVSTLPQLSDNVTPDKFNSLLNFPFKELSANDVTQLGINLGAT